VEPVTTRRRLLDQVRARQHVEMPASAGGGGAHERGGSRDADVRASMQPQQTEGPRRFSRQSAIRPRESGADGCCIVVVHRGQHVETRDGEFADYLREWSTRAGSGAFGGNTQRQRQVATPAGQFGGRRWLGIDAARTKSLPQQGDRLVRG
jgi:hypothetical protein